MARRKKGLGPNLDRVLHEAPVYMSVSLLRSAESEGQPIVGIPDRFLAEGADDSNGLVEFLETQNADVLTHLEDLALAVVDLSENGAATSLDTVAARQLSHEEHEEYEKQLDALCRSIWARVEKPMVFQDAQSFYAARRYRGRAKLYSAFEVDAEVVVTSDSVDTDALCLEIQAKLGLSTKSTATALDLPETTAHPRSVMVVIRHGGALSSVQDHRDDGLRRTRYYRPSNEAILIYTAAEQKLEVCAVSFQVREDVSKAFAEVVLGRERSNKPLTGKTFDLNRFRSSFLLPLPDFEDVEVTLAKVVQIETRLGSWKRLLMLRVTKDDDIERMAEQVIGTVKRTAARYGYSKVEIAVDYQFRGSGKSGTLKIAVNSSNASSVQNEKDPDLRDLGLRLLEFWGILERFSALRDSEVVEHFDSLLLLYDHAENEVEGKFLVQSGMDWERLVGAKVLEKKGRQDVVLLDEDDAWTEGDLETSADSGALARTGSFGEAMGIVPEVDNFIYRINRDWLNETVLNALSREFGTVGANVVDDHIAELGTIELRRGECPVYIVRCLAELAVVEKLDQEFRRRHEAGFGVVLSVGHSELRYLGPNVVIPLSHIIAAKSDDLEINPEALDQAFAKGRSLVEAADKPDLLRHGANHATLILPGRPPLQLEGAEHITLFERLLAAARDGSIDVKAGKLMEGMGSRSPQQLFKSKRWGTIKDVYLTSERHSYWRLCI